MLKTKVRKKSNQDIKIHRTSNWIQESCHQTSWMCERIPVPKYTYSYRQNRSCIKECQLHVHLFFMHLFYMAWLGHVEKYMQNILTFPKIAEQSCSLPNSSAWVFVASLLRFTWDQQQPIPSSTHIPCPSGSQSSYHNTQSQSNTLPTSATKIPRWRWPCKPWGFENHHQVVVQKEPLLKWIVILSHY